MMKTDNELIAEFMGIELVIQRIQLSSRVETRYYYKDDDRQIDLQYDESWDWLMPVVEKIFETAPKDVQEINNEGLSIFELGGICVPIQEVYKSVVEFIKWHNEKN